MNKPLRKCQIDAINSFDKHFFNDEKSRGIISMCCGSGKSYTIYNIIKKCILEYGKEFFIIATSRVHLIYQLVDDYIEWNETDNLGLSIRVIGGSGKKHKNITLCNETHRYDVIGSCKGQNSPLLIITTYNSADLIMSAIDFIHKKKILH